MDQTQKVLIEAYLTDETKLYQDWFKAMNPTGDDDVVTFAPFPPLDALKKRFKKWVETQHTFLQHKICEEWGYAHKKKTFQQKEAFIIALSVDCLVVALSLPTANALMVATILVVEGYLDRLCSNTAQK